MSDQRETQAARALLGVMPFVMRTIGRAMRVDPSESAPLLPQQYRLLGAIGRKPRTLGQIARIQGVTPATATTLVTTLESRGWVVREQDAEDRRRVVVSLTEQGVKRHAQGQAVAESAMTELLAPLSAEQLDRLLSGLAVLDELGGTELSR
jgi:DNA-binding MarR family transcriptional regulator